MIALISDVHANFEALRAVLVDIGAHSRDPIIYCLGDVVGYGPDPAACVDLIYERCSMRPLGN